MEYVLGLDGGGTKTELIVTDLAGTERISFIGGASNPKSLPMESVVGHLMDLLDEVHRKEEFTPRLCRGVSLGMAGIYLEEEKAGLHEQLSRYYTHQGWPPPPIIIMNDAQIALMAALGDTQGMIVIAGTGSIVYGISPTGGSYRTGGWGHLLGDQGSGYDIGLRTVQSIMLSFDRVQPPTVLTDLLLAAYDFESPAELRSYIYEPHIDKQHIAKFAELCLKAAEAGDVTALDILEKAASGLALLTEAMLRKDPAFRQLPVAITGSIFQHSRLFEDLYRKRLGALAEGLTIVLSQKRPAYGAALLAVKAWNKG